MQALRKITVIKNGAIHFNELQEWNDKEVEVIVFPLLGTKPDRKKLLKYSGMLDSGFTDTSSRVDELIYGK